MAAKIDRIAKKNKKYKSNTAKIFTGIFVAAFSSGDGFLLSAHTLRKPTPFVECSRETATPLEMVKRKKFYSI
jgi:hypothetical protein